MIIIKAEMYSYLGCLVKEELKVSREEATRRPWFLIDAQNTTSPVGQRAILEAQAGGRPLPTFRWYSTFDILLNKHAVNQLF